MLCCIATRMAAQSTVSVGYCAGEATDKGSISTEGKAWVSGAIYLPPDMLAPYKGNAITQLRAAMATKVNVDSLVLWVRTSLSGENMAEAVITTKTTPKLAKGWNEATLSSPLQLPTGQGLYIGMSYHQKAAAAALSVVGSQIDNACWVQLGKDAKWQDMSSAGILSIEAVVEGTNVPQHDLGLAAAMANTHDDASLTKMQVTVVNNGQLPVTGFTLQTRYEQGTETYSQHFDTRLAWGEKAVVEYQIPNLSTVTYGDIMVSLASIDDGEDETATNNSIKAKFALVKKILIEDFTTEPCGNCPRVSGYLHTVISQEPYKSRAIVVCHHSGYKYDWLTQSCDEKLAARFVVGYSPAIMIDRKPIWMDGALHSCPEMNELQAAVAYVLQDAAHVSINISADYNDVTQQLNITVSGKRDELKAQNPVITLYLTEDDVKAVSQAGATGGYWHQDVVRAFSSDFGEPISWEGNQYEYHHSFSISDDWVKDKMHIVAVVSNLDASNNKNCQVDNVETTGFPQSGQTQGVEGVSNSSTTISTEYFTADGQRLGQPRKGLMIVRKTDADGHVHSFKSLR